MPRKSKKQKEAEAKEADELKAAEEAEAKASAAAEADLQDGEAEEDASPEDLAEAGLLQDEPETPPFRGYRVTGQLTRGFWAAKQKFLPDKPIDLPIESLSEGDIVELDNTDPRYLKVERIGLDDNDE